MSSRGVTPMKRHEQYYLRDGNVCFVVEGTTFRLHRHFFERESAFFQKKLSPSSTGEDSTLDGPYTIDDVKVDEFAQLVWVWYNPHYSYSKKSKDDWLTILKLATRWQFEEIRNLAIRQLERLDLQPVEKIALYKEYRVNPDLLLPSYMSLCRNAKLPSPAEGKKLSLDTVLRLAGAREKILLAAMESGCETPTTASTPDDVTRAIISEFFDLTLHSNEPSVRMEGQVANVNGSASGTVVGAETVTVKEPKKGKPDSPPKQNGHFSFLNGVTGSSTGKGKNRLV